MDKRLNEIDKFIDAYEGSIKNNKNITKKNVSIILKKFDELQNFVTIDNTEITKGIIIKCVDLNMEKVSIPAIVVDIKYNTSFNNLKTIKNVTLLNNYKKSCWKIKPANYYIFKADIKSCSGLRSMLEKLLGEQIDKYKELLNL